MTEFNSVTSLVNSDLLTRTGCEWVRDCEIPNPPQNEKKGNPYTMHLAPFGPAFVSLFCSRLTSEVLKGSEISQNRAANIKTKKGRIPKNPPRKGCSELQTPTLIPRPPSPTVHPSHSSRSVPSSPNRPPDQEKRTNRSAPKNHEDSVPSQKPAPPCRHPPSLRPHP